MSEIQGLSQSLLSWISLPFQELRKSAMTFYRSVLEKVLRFSFTTMKRDLVVALQKRVAERYIQDFLQGRKDGRKSQINSRFKSEAYFDGFESGAAQIPLDSDLKDRAVEKALTFSKKKVTAWLVSQAFLDALHKVNPQKIVQDLVFQVRQHGWRLGLVLVLAAILDNVVLPSVVYSVTGDETLTATTLALPITEVLGLLVIRKLKIPKQVKPSEEEISL